MDPYQHFDAAKTACGNVTRELDPETQATAHCLLAMAGFMKIIAENTAV